MHKNPSLIKMGFIILCNNCYLSFQCRLLNLHCYFQLKQMLIKDSSKEHWRLWILKKYMLPYLYWNKIMKGKDV
jgi:hypothetical protein